MNRDTNTHEDYSRAHDAAGPSDRSFGITFGIIALAIAAWPLTRGGGVYTWALVLAALFFVAAWLAPTVLRPLNWVWYRFGLLLHRIVSPVILGVMFLLIITPTGILLRLFRKRPLDLEPDPDMESYWINRETPEPNSLFNQF